MDPVDSKDYHQLQGLFEPMNDHLAVLAVLAGATPGEVYVDDLQQPQSGLMRVHHRFYLVGKSDNGAFNRAVKCLFADRFYAQASGQGAYTLYISDGWQQAAEQEILVDLDPIFSPRQYLRFDNPAVTEEMVLPDGYELRQVDQDLLDNEMLGEREALIEELLSERSSIQEFLSESFGLVLIHDNQVVGWCLSEYNMGDRCEVGIATHCAYRKQGLATLIGKFFMNHAANAGMRKVGWHCQTSNLPSSASAQRIGFHLQDEYPAYFALYDRAANLCVHGDIELNQGQYTAAVEWLERGLRLGNVPEWAYIDAAAASARLERPGEAFHYLNMAVDQGFSNLSWLQQNQHLNNLHDTPEWTGLISRIERA